ncbi:MAG TPA: spore coat protein [Symbiobacteriaceae bacterium]|nr:spore coat protein [Symbiobacteriaceae bacterium]
MQQTQGHTQLPQPQFTFEGGHVIMFHHEAEGLPKQTDPNVNDRDRMQDLLSQMKYLSDGYDTAMNEASHDALFQVWKQNHSKVKDLERQVYATMFKKGWYRLPVADAQGVADAFSNARQLQIQLPFPSKMPDATGSRAPSQSTTTAMQQARAQAMQTMGAPTRH